MKVSERRPIISEPAIHPEADMKSQHACFLVIFAALAQPALAQKPGDRLASQVKGPDAEVIREAVNTIRQPGECMVEFTVGIDGKPKDMKPVCTPAEYAPYALRAMETVEYLPEIFDGEVFETEGGKQPFKFGVTTSAAATPGEKAPVKVKDVEPKDIQRAINRIDAAGVCQVTLTVAADGKPKDIQPNCTPDKYNKPIGEAVAKMRFEPGQKGGKAVDWPGYSYPLNLSAEN
jgi:hypothetical protein